MSFGSHAFTQHDALSATGVLGPGAYTFSALTLAAQVEDFSAGPTSHFADLVFTFALTPAVPEPSVWLLLGVAVAGAASLRRRYSKS